jgi:hypothetical protein
MRSADLLERLSCVSSPSGLDAINGVQNCVRMRALTCAQVLEYVLEDDENAPPLCCLAFLLQHGDIRSTDLPASDFAVRASDVTRDTGSHRCVCSQGAAGAFARIVELVAVAGQCRTRDDILSLLMEPLLGSGGTLPAQDTYRDALRLCSVVLQDLKYANMDDGDRLALFSEWTRTSLTASRVPGSSFTSAPSAKSPVRCPLT